MATNETLTVATLLESASFIDQIVKLPRHVIFKIIAFPA